MTPAKKVKAESVSEDEVPLAKKEMKGKVKEKTGVKVRKGEKKAKELVPLLGLCDRSSRVSPCREGDEEEKVNVLHEGRV